MAVENDDYRQTVPKDLFTPRPGDISLKIGVVGAGLGGLAAAIALQKSGHNVEIFERSKFANEIGAAIHIGPNATRVLDYLGLDCRKAKAVHNDKMRYVQSNNLAVLGVVTLPDWIKEYGADYWLFHRVDLHSGLKQLALDEGAKLHLATEVLDLEPKTGTITTEGGTTHKFDVVVAADGVHSKLSKSITGKENKASATGISTFRFMIPTATLLENKSIKHLIEGSLTTFTSTKQPKGEEPFRRIVMYPCRNSELFNFVCPYEEAENEDTKEGWNNAVSVDRLLETFKLSSPSFLEMFRHAEDLKHWKLVVRDPFSPWIKDRAVLIGDAAHPMLPYGGQGGAQSLEDAAAIGAFLSHIKSPNEIPERLELYQRVRYNRASSVQAISATKLETEELAKEKHIDNISKYFKDGQAIPKNRNDSRRYFFAYNVFDECIKAAPSLFKADKLAS